jgi:NADPH-dependent glutamate synthase beta subunit-like oxidoreductase
VLAAATRGENLNLGKKVAVVGGGNVAMDATRTALRAGASVDILYRRREEDMPADKEEIEEAKGEGARLIERAIPVEIKNGPEGRAIFVWNEARMVEKEAGKRPVPEAIPGAVREEAYDSVIAAIGQGPDLGYIAESDGVEFKRFKPVLKGRDGRTSAAKIFAGGDLTNDVKDAISAIADGHRAAQGIDNFLMGRKTQGERA